MPAADADPAATASGSRPRHVLDPLDPVIGEARLLAHSDLGDPRGRAQVIAW